MSERNFCIVILANYSNNTVKSYFYYDTLDECKNVIDVLKKGNQSINIIIMQKKIIQEEHWERIPNKEGNYQ